MGPEMFDGLGTFLWFAAGILLLIGAGIGGLIAWLI
jgi:hypothetical protein